MVVNDCITVTGIPERAHDYRLGHRSAVDWLIESFRVKTHKASGIRNDPNDWASELGQPRYILDLLGRVATVSLRSLELIDRLPELKL